jgi:nucleoside-diphosphate-sugar epimerase
LSYGTQKRIGELWVEDFSRRGWVDGRAVRIPGVLARPPARTGQLSAFLSDLIRELAAGRDFTCPTSPEASTWASSLPCVVEQLLHAASFDVTTTEGHRVLTLPTLRFAMAELVQAVGRVYGTPAADLVRWAPDDRIEALFGRFPPLLTPRAQAAGFCPDSDLEALVRQALVLG